MIGSFPFRTFYRVALLSFFVLALTAFGDDPSAVLWPGGKPDGSMLLPNLWSLRPAGDHVELGDFPVNIAVHPKAQVAAVLHCGYSPHEVVLVDLQKKKITSRAPLTEAFYGIVFSADGKNLYCSGASGEEIFRFDYVDGTITNQTRIPLRNEHDQGIPAGIVLDRSGRTAYVANLWNNAVSRARLSDNSVSDIVLAKN